MKIDTSAIKGYAEMSAEEKLKALEEYEIAEPDYTGYVKKEVFDSTASELAKKKKELNQHLSDEERAKAEREESDRKLKEDYEALLRKTNISEATAKYIALGYSEELARETAEAFVDGETDKVFANQQKANEALAQKLKAEILKDTPKPRGGGVGDGMTKETLTKMTSADRIAWALSNKEEYETLMKG